PIGYHRNAKKLLEASLKAGYDFSLDEVKDWLERQLLHLLHKPRPRYIPRASFSSITTPNEMHQADVLYTRHVKSRRTIYLFYLNVKDVASRYEAIVPIGVTLKGPAKSIKNMQERFYSILDAYDLLDTSSDIIELEDLAGVVDSIVEDLNNSVTRLLTF
ncbi:6153_t:CDS:2, partial [Rhizophagus irregularis]